MLTTLSESRTEDHALLITRAAYHGAELVIQEDPDQSVELRQSLGVSIECLRAKWSEHQSGAQIWGAGPTERFKLSPMPADDEKEALAVDYIVDMLPYVVHRVHATWLCFAVYAHLPHRSETLFVGGTDEKGERILGYMEITRDSEGHERLGHWMPVDQHDEDYFQLASGWLMNAFYRPRSLSSRLRSMWLHVLAWFG